MAIGKIPRYYWLERQQTLIPEKDFSNICSLYNSYGDESILPTNNIYQRDTSFSSLISRHKKGRHQNWRHTKYIYNRDDIAIDYNKTKH